LGENGVLATCLTPSGVGVLSGTLVCATDLGTRRILRPKILPDALAALASAQAAGTPNTSAVTARTVVGVTCGSSASTLPASFMANASTSLNIRIAVASAAVLGIEYRAVPDSDARAARRLVLGREGEDVAVVRARREERKRLKQERQLGRKAIRQAAAASRGS